MGPVLIIAVELKHNSLTHSTEKIVGQFDIQWLLQVVSEINVKCQILNVLLLEVISGGVFGCPHGYFGGCDLKSLGTPELGFIGICLICKDQQQHG